MNLIQTIIIRDDLGFSRGLMAAQVAHIHAEVWRNPSVKIPNFDEWVKSPYIHVRKVPNKEILLHIIDSIPKDMPCFQWYDTVNISYSETQTKALSGILVGIAIGPCDSDKSKAILNDLPFL